MELRTAARRPSSLSVSAALMRWERSPAAILTAVELMPSMGRMAREATPPTAGQAEQQDDAAGAGQFPRQEAQAGEFLCKGATEQDDAPARRGAGKFAEDAAHLGFWRRLGGSGGSGSGGGGGGSGGCGGDSGFGCGGDSGGSGGGGGGRIGHIARRGFGAGHFLAVRKDHIVKRIGLAAEQAHLVRCEIE